ncbi:DUF2341 domain-containing protein, partial [archaeon]|nr:DUF2341 domain-containing protein [archaeon]
GQEQIIDFWTENCITNGGNSTFWVEVPEIYAGAVNNAVYMYYGNAGASSASNGTNTFEFFDDFEDGDYSDWDYVDDGSIETTIMHTGTYAFKLQGGQKNFTENSGGDISLSWWVYRDLADNDDNYMGFSSGAGSTAGDDFVLMDYRRELSPYTVRWYTIIGGSEILGHVDSGYAFPSDQWMKITIDIIDGTSVEYNVYDSSGDLKATKTDSNAYNTSIYSKIYHLSADKDTYFIYDDIYIRKYTANEPTVFSVGAEIPLGISKGNAYAINANATHAFARINNQTITAPISAGWNHIALTYDKDAGGTDEMKLYINSVESETADYSTAITTNTDTLVVGNSFTGTIDEVRVYNIALTQPEIASTYNTADLSSLTTNPKASFNSNPTVNYTGTLADGESTTININTGNFTIGQNNITIYTDAGIVDYALSMNGLIALISNTGMNNVTVKQVVVFKGDGSTCILPHNETTYDVGDFFSVSGCPMSCDEFLIIKAYTDCTGVFGEFSRRPSGC